MSLPTVCWIERETRAQLEQFAGAQGVALERVAGDLLTAAVLRLSLPDPGLPDAGQPTPERHRLALDESKADLLDSMRRPHSWSARRYRT